MEILPQTEQEYWNITLDNRNRRYVEYPKWVYSILEELMLGKDGYEWLVDVAMMNSKVTAQNCLETYELTVMDPESILNV